MQEVQEPAPRPQARLVFPSSIGGTLLKLRPVHARQIVEILTPNSLARSPVLSPTCLRLLISLTSSLLSFAHGCQASFCKPNRFFFHASIMFPRWVSGNR